MSQNSDDASRNASRFLPACRSSVKIGTKAAPSAACENRLEKRFGTCEAIVNAEPEALVLKKLAWTPSPPSPAIRDSAVATAKMAVFRASRRRPGDEAPGSFGGVGGGGLGGPGGPRRGLSTGPSAL